MSAAELLDVLEDWFATATGSCSCGQAHGAETYRKAGEEIRALPEKERSALLSAFVRRWVDEKHVAQGYTWEDAKAACAFIEGTVLSESS